jgi:hypothetical protein
MMHSTYNVKWPSRFQVLQSISCQTVTWHQYTY